MEQNAYDLIVIGGGPMGLSTAWHASRRGWRTLVIEKNGLFNDSGSSAGASRQFRLQYSQQYMSELAIAAETYWADLQQLTLETLIGTVGSVWFGDPALSSQEGGIKAAMNTMDALSVPYTALDAAAIETRFKFRNLPANYTGFFQPNGGIINLKAAERAMFTAAGDSRLVTFLAWTRVDNITTAADGSTTASAGRQTYAGRRLALTPGAYVNDVLRPLGQSIHLYIWEMSSAYFRKANQDVRYPTWFAFQKPTETNLFYGFPEVDWAHPGYIRVASDIPDRIIHDPADRSPAPSPKSLALTKAFVGDHMTGLEPSADFTSTCLIALAPDKSGKEFLLDYLPGKPDAVVYTAGWAAKFIPIMGEMICQMLEGDVTNFSFGRFQIPRSHFAIDWQPAP